MESNIYTRFGKILKIPGTILVVVIFLYNMLNLRNSPSLGYSSSEIMLMVLVGILMYTAIFLVVFFTGKYLYNLGAREDTPLKHIQDWPTTLKVIGIISLIIIMLDVIFFFIVLEPCWFNFDFLKIGCDDIGTPLVMVFILLPILGFAVLLWIVPFVYYFIKQR